MIICEKQRFLKIAIYKMNDTVPKFSRYYTTAIPPAKWLAGKSIFRWIDDINKIVAEKLVPILDENGMLIQKKN